jgi:hypothetical protein
MLGALAFNFVVNAALSFAGAAAIVWIARRVFRPGPDRAHLALLALPWVKLAWDTAWGIPASSFFWQRLNGASQELGSFRIGFGINHWGPLVHLRLGAVRAGRIYPQSAAEVLSAGLSHRWPPLPTALSVLVLSISVVLVTRRVLGWLWHRRAQRRVELLQLAPGPRAVPVLIDRTERGSPYATGIVYPRVVFSAEHLARLSDAEREACLLHELSHIAHRDTLWAPLLDLLGDSFWFLPGSRWLVRRSRELLELRADAAAVAAGASPGALASALVVTAELMQSRPTPGIGLVRERLLSRRVRRLLEPGSEPLPRAGFQHVVLRIILAALLVATVLQAVFFGNQPLD